MKAEEARQKNATEIAGMNRKARSLPQRSFFRLIAAQRAPTSAFILPVLPLLFLLVFYFYPLLAILRLSFAPNGTFEWEPLRALVTRPRYRQVLWFSAWQAALSTTLTLLAGLPAAYLFARYRFRGKTLLRALATVPFVLPTVVVAAAWSALLGRNGMVNALFAPLSGGAPIVELDRSLTLLLLSHVFYNFTIVLRIVGGFWANLDPRAEAAAAVLGANRWRVWREITLPLLLPPLGAAALLIFVFTFTAFGTVLILGRPGEATLEVQIYREAINLFNLPVAAALSVIQILLSLTMTVVYTRLQERATVPLDLRPQRTLELPLRGGRRVLHAVVVGGMLLLLGAPLLALVLRVLTLGGDWSLRYFALLAENRTNSYFFVPPLTAVRNSLGFALLATLVALGTGVPASYLLATKRRRLRAVLDPLFMLPLGTSAVTLGFGYLIALDEPPLNFRASPLLIPLAHALVAFPFVVRTMLPVLRGIDPRLREAARVQGAGAGRVIWEVDVPIIGRTVVVAAVFAFTVSLGEFGATLLLNSAQYPTMPLVIFRFLGQPGAENYGQALAMSTMLMLVTAICFVLIERLRVGTAGEF